MSFLLSYTIIVGYTFTLNKKWSENQKYWILSVHKSEYGEKSENENEIKHGPRQTRGGLAANANWKFRATSAYTQAGNHM